MCFQLIMCIETTATNVPPSKTIFQRKTIFDEEIKSWRRKPNASPISRWLRTASKYQVIRKSLNRAILLGSDLYIPCLMDEPIGWLKGDYILYMDSTMMYDSSIYGSGITAVNMSTVLKKYECLAKIRDNLHTHLFLLRREIQTQYKSLEDTIFPSYSQCPICWLWLVLLPNGQRREICGLRYGNSTIDSCPRQTLSGLLFALREMMSERKKKILTAWFIQSLRVALTGLMNKTKMGATDDWSIITSRLIWSLALTGWSASNAVNCWAFTSELAFVMKLKYFYVAYCFTF